jgi:hypothetical protein
MCDACWQQTFSPNSRGFVRLGTAERLLACDDCGHPVSLFGFAIAWEERTLPAPSDAQCGGLEAGCRCCEVLHVCTEDSVVLLVERLLACPRRTSAERLEVGSSTRSFSQLIVNRFRRGPMPRGGIELGRLVRGGPRTTRSSSGDEASAGSAARRPAPGTGRVFGGGYPTLSHPTQALPLASSK